VILTAVLTFHMKEGVSMLKKLAVILLVIGVVLTMAMPLMAQGDEKVFYWVSHGDPADPVWVFFLGGAEQFAADTGHEVRASFHSNDVPSHQEAIRAAIAAGATGIATSNPDPGTLTEVIAEAHAAGIPVVIMNTEDKGSGRDAYVGGDNYVIGANWAQYLVDGGYVTEGDFVWMPVEVPGASYQVNETEGIDSVFGPLGITYEISDAQLDQAEIITRMSDYLTANGDEIDAIIGLGDLVTGSIARVFDQVGVEAGSIPVVGWGNSCDTVAEVRDGYVLAATWQDPQLTSYLALAQVMMAAGGIPPTDVIVGTMYGADKVDVYAGLMGCD
jgi:simple sugar transport system substrate-binding protein